MKAQAADDAEVLTAISWEDKRWSWTAPHAALHAGSALEYFSHSQFYDRTCLNEQLKMQGRTLSLQEVNEKLRRLPGIVYQLDGAKSEGLTVVEPTAAQQQQGVPPRLLPCAGGKVTAQETPPSGEPAHTLYVIRKLQRGGDGSETTLRFYYILDGIVYEAPTLAAVMRARILRISFHLRQAFALATKSQEEDDEAGVGQDASATAAPSTGKRKR